MTTRRQITLPEDLCSLAEREFASHFEGVESLLEFVLKEITQKNAANLDQAELAILEDRLRNLGYM
jgi:hypothetical protein